MENTTNPNNKTELKSTSDDADLDELLDSALDDFDKQDSRDKDKDAQLESSDETSQAQQELPPQNVVNPDEMFSEVFDAAFAGDEGSKQLEDMLKAFLDPETLKSIEKIAEAAGSTDETAESKQKFEDTLQQTLGELAQNAEGLQNDLPDDELLRMMTNMAFQTGQPDDGSGDAEMDFMPMMQSMMKSLITKDVLYPSLKEIVNKYPSWLAENKEKVNASDYERYSQQNYYMTEICTEFEKETSDDTEHIKKARFDKILDLMQNMQELGHPPKDITGDNLQGMPGMPLDENGMPKMPSNPDQCVLM